MTTGTASCPHKPRVGLGPILGLGVALAVLALTPWQLAALDVPFLEGRVNDLADLIPDPQETRIELRLERLEDESGAQVAVLTIPSLEGEVLEDYSLRVAETWRLGRGEFDDGALLLIASEDRKMRLEVGYGLEPAITDLASRRILDDVMAPYFRQGDFGGGVEAAVEVIAGLVRGEDALPPPGPPGRGGRGSEGGGAGLGILLGVAFFSLMAISSRGCVGWLLYLAVAPLWFSVPLSLWGSPMGFIPGLAWLIGFPILWGLVSRTRPGRGSSRRGGWSSRGGWGGGFGGGGFGGGGFGGGFSGGGGGFGGGGASGSW